MVGAGRIELPTSSVSTRCSTTKLYAPAVKDALHSFTAENPKSQIQNPNEVTLLKGAGRI